MPYPIRFVLLLLPILLTRVISFAQSAEAPRRTNPAKTTTYSASGDWQKVVMKPTARLTPATGSPNTPTPAAPPVAAPTSAAPPAVKPTDVARTEPTPAPRNEPTTRPRAASPTDAGFRPAFTGDFATNRNGWKAGVKGDYHFQIGLGRYNIRRLKDNTKQVALSYVPLPADLNLNVADVFAIKVDMLADSGRIPSGGLVFGVRDSLNYNAFTLNGKGAISILRVANGETFSDYMPGDYFAPGVPVDKNRNRLSIRRKGEALHFYINEQEVRSSPYPFKMLAGNSIGMITSASWTSFQKLSVTLGGSTADFPGSTRAAVEPAITTASSVVPSAVDPAPAVPNPPKTTRLAPVLLRESFTENKNGWFVGNRKGYAFSMAGGRYSIRRLPGAAQETGRCYIELPTAVNLNKAQSFTVSVEMIALSGQLPEGGLLLGVKDVDNLIQFSLADKRNVVIKSIRDGRTFAGYMPGKPSPAGTSVKADRNTLTISRKQDKLHFYLNGQEVESSPYDFRTFRGNGIGFTVGRTETTFRNLVVQVEPGQ